MENLLLTIPEQLSANDPAVELNPKRLKEWVAGLPVSDVLETVSQLDKSISAFNESKIGEADRIKLLEIYREEAFEYILQSYDEMRLKQLKISNKERQKLTKDIMWLYAKLAHGYKIIVKDCFDEGENPKRKPSLLLAIFRSLELSCFCVMYAYRSDTNAPPLVFLEANQLYAYAESTSVLYQRIKTVKGYAKPPTISGFYKLMVLLFIIKTNTFDTDRIEPLFYAIQGFSNHCHIGNDLQSKNSRYQYVVNLREDQAPLECVNKNLTNVNEWTRTFYIETFINEIASWLEQNKDSNQSFFIEQELELLPVLLEFFESIDGEDIEFAPITAAFDIQPPIPAKEIPKGADTVKLVIGFLPLQSLLISESIHLRIGLSYNFSEWIKANETEIGCDLIIPMSGLKENIALGDAIALTSLESSSVNVIMNKIALVTRAELLINDNIFIQVVYLSNRALPATFVLVNDKKVSCSSEIFNCICLIDTENENKKIMMDKRYFEEQKYYLLQLPNEVITITPSKIVRDSIQYVVFEYTEVSTSE